MNTLPIRSYITPIVRAIIVNSARKTLDSGVYCNDQAYFVYDNLHKKHYMIFPSKKIDRYEKIASF